MTKMPMVAEGEPVTSGGVSWEVIEERREGGVVKGKRARTGLDAVDSLVGAFCLVFLLGYDRGNGAAGLGVPGDLLDVLHGGWLRHCGRLFVKVSSVVVVDLCCWEERKADWEFYHGGGVM